MNFEKGHPIMFVLLEEGLGFVDVTQFLIYLLSVARVNCCNHEILNRIGSRGRSADIGFLLGSSRGHRSDYYIICSR